MAGEVTQTQLQNAATDLDDLADIVNGAADINGTGLVSTRTGGDVKTMLKLQADYMAQSPAIAFATEAALLADLDHDADSFAFAIDTARYYIKSGASGAGSWSTAPKTRVDIAFDHMMLKSAFPDPRFRMIGNDGDLSYEFDGKDVFSAAFTNWTWDASKVHALGKGAYKHDSGSSSLSGFVTWFTTDSALELGLVEGEKVSIALVVQTTNAQPVKLYSRFFQTTPTNYITSQEVATITGDGGAQVIKIEDLTVPASCDGVHIFMDDGSGTGDFWALAHWVVKGSYAGDAPPLQSMVEWEEFVISSQLTGYATAARATALETATDIQRNNPLFAENVVRFDPSLAIYESAQLYGPETETAGFTGWASPFDWDGTEFDTIAIGAQVSEPMVPLQVTVWSGDQGTLHAEGFCLATEKVGEYLCRLNARVDGSAGILYIAVQSYDNVAEVWPGDVTGFTDVGDTTTYPQKYATASLADHLTADLSTWNDVAAETGWPLAFKLYDSAVLNQKLLASTFSDGVQNAALAETLEALYDPESAAYSNGDFYKHVEIASTFSGWAQPFDWDESAFDTIRFPYSTDTPGKMLRVSVWNGAATDRIAYGDFMPLRNKGFGWVRLNKRVSSSLILRAVSPILYVTIEAIGGGAVLANQAANNFDHVADPATYPQRYATTSSHPEALSSWNTVSGNIGRPYLYWLFDSQSVTTSGHRPKPVHLMDPSPVEPIISPRLFGLEGVELNVYLKDLHSGKGHKLYDTTSSHGRQDQERWSLTPTSSAVNGSNVTFQVLDPDDLTVLAERISVLWTAATGDCNTETRKVLCIGDSTTNAGYWTQQMLDRATEESTNLQLTLIGTQGTTPNLHEGRGGWTVARYYEPGATYYADNPFTQLSTDKFSASYYLSNEGLDTPDIVIWHLGINDVFSLTTDAAVHSLMDTFLQQLDEMIGVEVAGDVDSWKESNANITSIVALPISPGYSQDGFGADYNDDQNQARYKRNITIAAWRIYDHYKGSEGDNIFLLPWNVTVDSENNFPTTTGDTNEHNTTQVADQSDGIHPSASGYKQMGDCAYAALNVLVANGLA